MNPQDPSHAARNKLVINLLLISAFVVILNETIMGVAIPRLMVSFNVAATAAQWLTTAFLITTATVIPITGFMLQRMNTRPIFILAMSLFSLGTLAASLAGNLQLLIAARVVQACGTAIMMPLLMTTVMTLVPPASRGKTMGNISMVISVAPAIGPTLSGIVLNYLHWRWMFIIVLPIAIGALILGARKIENVTTPRYAPLDVFSVILSALAFGGLVYGISNLGLPATPGTPPALAFIGVGAAAMVVFVTRQLALQKKNAALLDLRTFKSYNFSVAIITMALMMMALFGVIIILPIYLQNVLGLTTLHTGLLLLPGGLIMGLLGPRVGRLNDRFGAKKLLVPGVIIVSTVLWSMTLLGPATPVSYILAGHIVMSVGFALLFTPLFTLCLGSVKPELYSHGSATLSSIQQVAGAAGVALLVALMSGRSARLVEAAAPTVQALAGGVRLAFLTAAVVSLCAVVCILLLRPTPPAAAAPVPH